MRISSVSAEGAVRMAEQVATLLRPELGGPSPWLTPAAPAGAAADPQVIAAVAAAPDLGVATVTLVAVGAAIGFMRGFRREMLTLVVAAGAAVVLGRLWSSIALFGNRLWRIFVFAVVERGVLAEDPTQAWAQVRGQPGLLPPAGQADAWQIGLFVTSLLLVGYGGARLVASAPPKARGLRGLPVLLERIVGGMVGAITGLITAHFTLPRLVPGARVSILRPESALYEQLAPYGPAMLLGAIVFVILFGVSAIQGGKPSQRTYS